MQIAPDQIDPDAAQVVRRLRDNGHLAYLVGGCVRDLLLGLKPKDFDVVTSATPPEIKRLFKNSRIIGRRFRLAHVFYGPKIIETSTFRANPRELEDEERDANEAESGDILIRRDNVFGTPEEDARRRDFTINGLFYDTKTGQVIDHVEGMVDLEARVVRTIGDPDIRFREDPIRILRAVKFAARCSLTIEPETYRRMMEHRGEIAKSAQARVSEEFFRLLRAGAARRSMELLVETDLLEMLVPELARGLRPNGASPAPIEATPAPAEAPTSDTTSEASSETGSADSAPSDVEDAEAEAREGVLRRARLWAYLAALDRSTERASSPPSNALILAVLLLPPLRDALDPSSNGVRDVGQLVARSIAPALERLRPSRRDNEVARQLLIAIRSRLGKQKRHGGHELDDEMMRLCQIVLDAEGLDPTLVGRPILAEGSDAAAAAIDVEAEGESELENLDAGDGRRRRRGRRGRTRDDQRDGQRDGGQPRDAQPRDGQPRDGQPRDGAALAGTAPSTSRPSARPSGSRALPPAPVVKVDIDALLVAARGLLGDTTRPGFLGSGTFGGPWSYRGE